MGTPPWVDFGGRTEAEIQLFQNMVMLHIKLKGNYTCMNMVANILPIDHLPGVGSKAQNSTFSQHGPVAYQIKGNG